MKPARLEDLAVIERRNELGEGGWLIIDTETASTLAGPFQSERDAALSAAAIERWAEKRERLLREEAAQ
jgi:hypothetical protein